MATSEYQRQLDEFFDSDVTHPLLGLVYGRRRIGKSTMLVGAVRQRQGFYYEAARVDTRIQLSRLGDAMGRYLGTGRLALDGWEDAIHRLIGLATDGPLPIVLDEFGHVTEAEPAVASYIASALGPGADPRSPARIVLCGSAIAFMRSLTGSGAPLRGRAGMEMVMWPDDYRRAATRLGNAVELDLAVRVFAVIGGVVGYATDMVAFDLPQSSADFDRWIAQRILSPAATLHHEAATLLAEDPTLAAASGVHHHSILTAIGAGARTAGTIAKRVGRPVPNLAPALNRLVDTGFIVRHEDPVRGRRPTYHLNDPYLSFNYAVLEPHRAMLRDRGPEPLWRDHLVQTFSSQVRGPVFEEQARTFVRRFAGLSMIGGVPANHIGPSEVSVDGVAHEVDVMVAADGIPAERRVLGIGEAKAGKTMGQGDLARLRRIRSALGTRGADARLLLFAPAFSDTLMAKARGRSDVELIDLNRLYHGS